MFKILLAAVQLFIVAAAHAQEPAKPALSSMKPIKREIILPRLITKALLTPGAVCADAKARDPKKHFALIIGKTHVCDLMEKVCLKTLRDISDSCNLFLRQNFAIYHTRPYSYTADGKVIGAEQDGANAVMDAWAPNGGPNLHVIDLASCKEFPRNEGLGLDGLGGKMPATQERFRLMREQILRIDGVRQAMGPAANYEPKAPEFDCLAQPEKTVQETWGALDAASTKP